MTLVVLGTLVVLAGIVWLVRRDNAQADATARARSAWETTGRAQPGWDPRWLWAHPLDAGQTAPAPAPAPDLGQTAQVTDITDRRRAS
jgi:hypothetical protein